jgi:hypothetical protein
MILKEFYMASERIKARGDGENLLPLEPFAGFNDSPRFDEDRADQEMAEGAGQFSPTYIANEAALRLEENNAFAGETEPFFEQREPSFEKEEVKPYKIDLFDQAKKVQSESDSSSDSSSESDAEESESSNEVPQNIEVPASVISRFFANQESIQAYLTTRTKETTQTMLDDLCSNFTLRDSTSEDLTELAYILFECSKQQLAQKDLLRLTSKWRDLAFVHVFRYLVSCASAGQVNSFMIIANLIRSLAQFDTLFEAKFLTHLLLETESVKNDESRLVTLQKYAELAYKPFASFKQES